MAERQTAAVLGASGFIGNRLTESLLLNDLANVRPIVRSFRGLSRLARFEVDSRIADATDRKALAANLAGCDVVFHCVVGGHATIIKSIEATYRAAADAGVRRLVYLSSAVVHGHNPAPGTTDDSELVSAQDFEYNVSKVQAEFKLRELSRDGAVETVVLRPCIVFGPRSQWWTAQIATQLLLKSAYLVEGGSAICNTIYVDNLVHAMWLAATVPGAAGQAFLLTDAERVTWRDFYASIAAAVKLDLSDVTNVSVEEMRNLQRSSTLRKRFAKIKQSPVSRMAIGMMSEKAKHVARAVLSTPPPPPGTPPPPPGGPAVDPEVASLQWCERLLPITKAQTVLGYQPQVGFAEASNRTAAWIQFALGGI
jgi:nucleoside-diphosphate-sugar epimerase